MGSAAAQAVGVSRPRGCRGAAKQDPCKRHDRCSTSWLLDRLQTSSGHPAGAGITQRRPRGAAEARGAVEQQSRNSTGTPGGAAGRQAVRAVMPGAMRWRADFSRPLRELGREDKHEMENGARANTPNLF